MNREERVRSIVYEMKLTAVALSKRLASISFTDTDRAALAVLGRRLEEKGIRDGDSEIFNELADAFFQPEAGGSEPGAPAIRMRPLRGKLGEYIAQLCSGNYDMDYAASRVEIGVIHQDIGVTQADVAAAWYRMGVKISDAVRNPDVDERAALSILQSLQKIMLFDLSLIMESYTHSEHQSIEFLVTHDTLTGLPNRNRICEASDVLLSLCDEQHPVSLFFVGLNRFKAVNETLGHPVGDAVLKAIAKRLTDVFSIADSVGRIGGDIFVCVAPAVSEEEARKQGERILTVLNRPLKLEECSVDISVVVGAATATDSAVGSGALMRRAEIALYHAKSRRMDIAFYAEGMKRYSVTELAIGADLRRAIDADELVLFYQPKIQLIPRRIIGVEALVRWMHPIRGMVPPGKFIPAAEESAVIHPLTDWVLTTAIERTAAWRRNGVSWTMSVNLSAANLQNQNLADRIESLLLFHAVDPATVIVEITESALMADPARGMETVRQLKQLGLHLSIDDFGTGYSSLAYLKDLPVDEVKVDQAFIFNMQQSDKDARIVRGTVFLGHSLGLSVTAEGVENEETLISLEKLGCDTAQGYHIARPMPEEDLFSWAEAYASQ